ncbi:MAG: hypothetical protein U0237_12115 [Thermoleophilia bacterium]
MTEPAFAGRVAAEIAPHLPAGFTAEVVDWDGGDGVRVWLGDVDLGSVEGDWEAILDGVEDLVSGESGEPFQIPRPGRRPD